MSNLQAQAAQIEARINTLGAQEEALAERYDKAQYELGNVQASVQQAQATLTAAQARTAHARQALKQDAIQAYVNGGSNPLAMSDGAQNATAGLLRDEYIHTLATNQTEDIDQYRLATLQEQTDANRLKRQEGAAQAQVASLSRARAAVTAADTQLTSEQQQVGNQIAKLKAEELAAERAAAAAAAAQREAAAAAARARAQQLAAEAAQLQAQQNAAAPTEATVSVNYNPPPAGSGASGALAAAESRIGDPYVWGAAGPNAFDCSGLVMWAYAQVGVSLPHFSGAQYSDTTHIPMSDLQPGDLVFFSDPGEHVAMYVGNGEIIEAPHSGSVVHIVPMYSGFTLAGRIE
jgi:cell wall-associated NlpC family hydrolase